MQKYGLIMIIFMLFSLLPDDQAAGNWLQRGKDAFQERTSAASDAGLSDSEITRGLKEALRTGSENVISHLGRENGFYQDPKAHIPLPESLQRVQGILDRAGRGHMLEDLELRMNRAAEKATPRARDIFTQAIAAMTLEDVREILSGPDDSATRYFQGKMSEPLADEFTPIVQEGLSEAGAVQTYDDLMGEYRRLPFVPDVRADLTSHVVDHALEAIFDYLAVEEAGIRNDPVQRTTDILRRVFGR